MIGIIIFSILFIVVAIFIIYDLNIFIKHKGKKARLIGPLLFYLSLEFIIILVLIDLIKDFMK
jgi:hypothetical protein